jgi:hypothetical protein
VTEIAQATRSSSWIKWYRLARRVLDYEHQEAADYANLRFVEEGNRVRLRRKKDGDRQPG